MNTIGHGLIALLHYENVTQLALFPGFP